VLRAIGLSVRQVRRLALAEALLVGGMAVVAGVLLGAGLARWSTGQLSGLSTATVGAGVRPGAVSAVAGVLAVGVLVVAAVRARVAVSVDVPSVVREQAS
jgi:putative ABC transport system permease protein